VRSIFVRIVGVRIAGIKWDERTGKILGDLSAGTSLNSSLMGDFPTPTVQKF
jgi:hypothetical protein